MFKSAATKIAHNTTIPALAGNSDLRPLQDLITAEKTVLLTLQKLRIDLIKAGDALRIWGQGEGDDLGEILTASSAMLAHFAAAVSTYSSLHHTVRDSMKSVRTREEALDDLRRRRRRVGASAETAEKKLNKMSPEHKNLGVQTDMLNRLRDEMRALDGEIIREEAELGDYKRKCTREWMGFKFGGLVECCEKGVIVGDIGKQIVQHIPEDVTQPGLPRAHYDTHGRVGGLVTEAQRAVSQVTFSGNPSGTSIPAPRIPPPTSQHPPVQSPFLPTPSLGSELTLGASVFSPPPGPPPLQNRRASVDELGTHAPSPHAAPQYSSLPTNRERDLAVASPVAPTQPLSLPMAYDSGAARTDENQSLMASIADALSQSHRAFSLEEATSLGHTLPDEPAPKYEPIDGVLARSVQSEPHGPTANGHVATPPQEGQRQWHRRATRRSTSPPSLPPGAAPAAIRAWDDRMGQGEDGAHSDDPASSSARMPSSQPPTSSSERDGEEGDDLAYDLDRQSLVEEGGDAVDGKHQHDNTSFSESGGRPSMDVISMNYDEKGVKRVQESLSIGETSNRSDDTSLSRPGSQRRISRVPPPTMDEEVIDDDPQNMYGTGTGAHDDEDLRTDESADERARNAAATREVERAMDALMFSAAAPSSGGHARALPQPGHGMPIQSQVSEPYPHTSPPLPPSALGKVPYGSAPSSPTLHSSSADRIGPSPLIEGRQPRKYTSGSNESVPARVPTPTPTFPPFAAGGGPGAPTAPRPASPMYRSPPPEYPRPTPPFSSPLMARSTSELTGGASPSTSPRMISAAAFRRPQGRSPSGADLAPMGPADTSPLTLRRPSGTSPPPQLARSPSPSPSMLLAGGLHKGQLSVVNPDPRVSDDEEGGGEHGGERVGYGAGKYVSDLERDG